MEGGLIIGLLAKIFGNKGTKTPKGINIVSTTSSSVNTQKSYDNNQIRLIVNKIADLVASTPIKHYCKDADGKVKEDNDKDFIWCLNYQASPHLTAYLMKKQLVARVLLYNDAFAWIHRDSFTGEILEILPIISESFTLMSPQERPDRLYVRFNLKGGAVKTLPYEELIHLVNNFTDNDFFGDNNQPLIEISSINSDLWNSLVSWTKNNAVIKGFLKTDTILKKEDMEQAKQDFSDLLKSNLSSYMTLDGKFNYIPVNDKSSPMDVNYISKVESTMYRYFSICEPILTGMATPEQWESFHKVCLQPLYSMIQNELDIKLFSKKEIMGFNHKILFVCSSFEHMTPTEKNSAFTLLTNQGAITINELREGYGFSRIDDGDKFMYSKNFAEQGKTKETSDNSKDNEEKDNKENKEEKPNAKEQPSNTEEN